MTEFRSGRPMPPLDCVHVWCEDGLDGPPRVMAQRNNGTVYTVGVFTPAGEFQLAQCLPDNLGFKLRANAIEVIRIVGGEAIPFLPPGETTDD